MRNSEITELREKVTIFTPKSGLTEAQCISRFNEALKTYIDHDSDSEGILYLEINNEEAKKLFCDMFENATFEEYLETYIDDPNIEGLDIVPMWGLLCDIISEDIHFNSKTRELYKVS